MRKRRTHILACSVLVLLLCAIYYLCFTRSGENLFYNTFGGNDLHIIAGNKEIYWFDVHHSNHPNSPMFKRLENTLLDFNPDLVLVEGGYDDFTGDKDTAIYNGESAFATWVAKQNTITVEDIEPPFDKQIEYLSAKYTADEILAMYLIRQISSEQFKADISQTDFTKLLLEFTQELKTNGLNYSGKSEKEILDIINSYLPEAINADNWRSVDSEPIRYVYGRNGGPLYPIYSDTVSFRNIWLVELIKEKKNTYDKIYVVMGGDHLAEIKDRITELYTD